MPISERCLSCYYAASTRSWDKDERVCDYILMEGHSRGCPSGDGCTKYRPGPHPKVYRMIHDKLWESLNE